MHYNWMKNTFLFPICAGILFALITAVAFAFPPFVITTVIKNARFWADTPICSTVSYDQANSVLVIISKNLSQDLAEECQQETLQYLFKIHQNKTIGLTENLESKLEELNSKRYQIKDQLLQAKIHSDKYFENVFALFNIDQQIGDLETGLQNIDGKPILVSTKGERTDRKNRYRYLLAFGLLGFWLGLLWNLSPRPSIHPHREKH